jgi:hypothetical protein
MSLNLDEDCNKLDIKLRRMLMGLDCFFGLMKWLNPMEKKESFRGYLK